MCPNLKTSTQRAGNSPDPVRPPIVVEHVFGGVRFVKTVVQVKLLPAPGQASALAATLHACNQAACATI
jgi:hypothetical protein